MAWFITSADPALSVEAPGVRVRFKAGEYRTEDAAEIAALRRCSQVVEVLAVAVGVEPIEGKQTQAPREIVRRYAVCLADGGVIHDLGTMRPRCAIPESVTAAAYEEDAVVPEGWKLYRREQDARRWNRRAVVCQFCIGGEA